MSDVRKLQLKVVDAPATRPKWLAAEAPQLRRPAFDPRPPFEHEDEGAESTGIHPSANADAGARADEIPPGRTRRSSLPPRNSVPPPPVVITRLPPPPSFSAAEVGPVSDAEKLFGEAALEIASLRARLVSGMEVQLLELAVSIAEAIVEREIERDPKVLATLAKTALSALGDANACRLRVSREAHRSLTEQYGESAVDVDGVRVEMVLDHSLEGLDLVAETPASRVDGRLKERFSQILRALEAEQRREPEDEAEV